MPFLILEHAREAHRHVAALDPASRRATITERCARAQASLDLRRGPIARALYFACGAERPRLLVTVHHFAVDGVSWRILLEDLETLLHGDGRLMAPSASVQEWSEELARAAESPATGAALDFWRGRLEDARTLFTLEMVRIPVAKFVQTKEEPTNTDLQAIYDRYKTVTPDPENNIVGFQRPATAEFEYASIPTDKWLDQVQVTDEECKKYYDANQSEFRDELPIEQPPAVHRRQHAQRHADGDGHEHRRYHELVGIAQWPGDLFEHGPPRLDRAPEVADHQARDVAG